MTIKAQRITDSIAHHAEGPVWWAATGRLRFVDMLHGAIIEIDDDGGHQRLEVPSRIASMLRPRVGGGAVVGLENGIGLARQEDLSDLEQIVTLFEDSGLRTNEGGCDPQGRLWLGDMAYEKTEGASSVYRWDGPGTEPQTAWDGATIANGIGWSPDGDLAYWNDTPTGRVTVFDHDPERGPVDPRAFVRIPEDAGHPDGLTVDSEGGIWTALNGGSAVHRYSPEGELTEVIELPVRQITACTFGGPDLDRLFITTSRENLPDDEEPAAGSIYAVEPGVRGMQPLAFGG